MKRSSSDSQIEDLRRHYIHSAFFPKNGSPPWLEGLAQISASGLGVPALISPAGLYIKSPDSDRDKATYDAPSLLLAGLCDRIAASHSRFSVGIPPAARHLPLLIAASVVLEKTLERHRGNTQTGGSGVLIVSPDLELRTSYPDIYIKNVSLDDAHPGSRLRQNGQMVFLRPDATGGVNDGVCFFFPQINHLPSAISFRPGFVILDFRFGRFGSRALDLLHWLDRLHLKAGICCFYTLGDRETVEALKSAGLSDVPFDDVAIQTCLDHLSGSGQAAISSPVDWSLTTAAGFMKRSHRIRWIPGGEQISNELNEIADFVAAVDDPENRDVKCVYGLLSTFSHLMVPLGWYEETARDMGRYSIKRTISMLGLFSQTQSKQRLGPILQTVRMRFENLYSTFEQANPRANSIKLLLSEGLACSTKERLRILVADRIMERVGPAWIQEQCGLDAGAFDVQAFSSAGHSSDTSYVATVVHGAFPRRHRWMLGGNLGRRIVFWAYPSECEGIVRQLEWFYSKESREVRRRDRWMALGTLLPDLRTLADRSDSTGPTLQLKAPQFIQDHNAPRSPKVSSDSFADLSKLLEQTNKLAQEQQRQSEQANTWSDRVDAIDEEDDLIEMLAPLSTGDLSNYVVEIPGREKSEILTLPKGHIVEFIRPPKSDICKEFAENLVKGDILLWTYQNQRDSLFDRLVELVERQPHMDTFALYRKEWKKSVSLLVQKYRSGDDIDFSAMLHDLQLAGATIQSQIALKFWARGLVIGPEEEASIKAVGTVIGASLLIQRTEEFDKAFSKIRAIHQALGRRLANALRQCFSQLAAETYRPSQIEQRFGIAIDELIDTVEPLEIITISHDDRSIKAKRLEKAN